MAIESDLKKKRRGGWIEVEEPTAPASMVEPVVIETSEVPKTLALSWDVLQDALSSALGAPLWHQYESGQCDLKPEQRTAVLETVLDDLPLSVSNVELLIADLNKSNESGWTLAGSFPAVVRIAQDWLVSQGMKIESPKVTETGQRLLDAMNPSNIQKFLLEIGVQK